jgi:DNA-binding transcriptional LysR family regulator
MLFRKLEYLVSVAREGHVARPAKACYLSGPVPSASIARLEHKRGVALIGRADAVEGLTAAIGLGRRSHIRGTSTVRTSSIQ